MTKLKSKVQSSDFVSKIVCSKIENLVKNLKFDQKSKIWSKIDHLVKNKQFDENSKIS